MRKFYSSRCRFAANSRRRRRISVVGFSATTSHGEEEVGPPSRWRRRVRRGSWTRSPARSTAIRRLSGATSTARTGSPGRRAASAAKATLPAPTRSRRPSTSTASGSTLARSPTRASVAAGRAWLKPEGLGDGERRDV